MKKSNKKKLLILLAIASLLIIAGSLLKILHSPVATPFLISGMAVNTIFVIVLCVLLYKRT